MPSPGTRIAGTAFDENDAPISGMIVYTWLASESQVWIPPNDFRVRSTARSGAQGAYTLTLSQGGDYFVAAYAVRNNTHMTDNSATVSVAVGQTTTYDLRARTGYYLRIDEVSPSRSLAVAAGSGGTINLSVDYTQWNRQGNPTGRGHIVIGVEGQHPWRLRTRTGRIECSPTSPRLATRARP
jgi:hypothetical protein